MHCSRCNRSGRMCEVARCGVCYVCHSETPGISSLDKQTLVNFFCADRHSSGAKFEQSSTLWNLLKCEK